METVIGSISLLLSFLVALSALPYWIRRARSHGLVGKDVHKKKKTVAEAGGIMVVLGATIGILFYIALNVFYFKDETGLSFILAALCSILIALMIGFVDDILGWRIGIRQKHKVLISLLIPIPMMVVNSGHHIMQIPFIGQMDFGILYPLLLIPLAIVGTSNAFNMLAGYNGLEAGQGFIILAVLGALSFTAGSAWAAIIPLSFAAALLAFLRYNWYPARVFPGDTMTYPVGAAIGITAILGNIERFAIIIFALYYIEFFLKAKGRFVPDWKSRLKGKVLMHKGRWNTMAHVAISTLNLIRIRPTERNAVSAILIAQASIALSTIAIFYFF